MQKKDLAAERATTEELQNQRVKMQDEMEALRGQILAVDLSKKEALMQRNFYKNESESHAKAIAQLQQKIPVIEAELKQACEKKLNDTNATWKEKLTEKDGTSSKSGRGAQGELVPHAHPAPACVSLLFDLAPF